MKRTGKNPQGFEPIPTSQIIFLHPGASLEWRDARKGSTDSRTKPAVYLEVLGINKWRWNEDTGAMIGGKGLSLIVSYTQRDAAKDFGVGLMFHSRRTRQFTLGITRVDLAEYVKDKLSYWKSVGQRIDGLRNQVGGSIP